MYNLSVRKVLFLFSFLILFLSFKTSVLAEKINSFNVEITAHKDGTMSVTENINYDFESEERHGIERFIPTYSKVGDLYRIINVKNIHIERDGKKEEFKTEKNKEQIYFRIGDADKTISGSHTYKISYTVENGIGSNYATHDEIYWNATGNYWHAPIEKASISINTDFGVMPNRVACFTRDGSLNAQFCTFPSHVFNPVTTTSPMHYGDGLTVVYGYPKGTFPPSTLVKELPKSYGEKILGFIIDNLVYIYLFLNTILPILIFIWYQKHKNKKRFGEPVVNFDLPKDSQGHRLPPALAGTIDNAKLDRDDVLATLFDLAIRKYIKFEETKTKRDLLPDSHKQKIIKLKDDDGKLNTYEKELFNRLFKNGNEVHADELKTDFYKTYQQMEESVFAELVRKKYFIKNPKAQRALLFVLATFCLASGNIVLSLMLFYLSVKLLGRTEAGDEIDYKIDGLKLFLKSMNRNYNWQSEKFITIEQMIPYAMSLGFIDKFMEQLKLIKPDYSPTWYSGFRGSFYTSYHGFYSSVNSNITTSAPSSSSGFSGGSSGGGGGGGGGGSW
jgi:uncharacterized membrane protein